MRLKVPALYSQGWLPILWDFPKAISMTHLRYGWKELVIENKGTFITLIIEEVPRVPCARNWDKDQIHISLYKYVFLHINHNITYGQSARSRISPFIGLKPIVLTADSPSWLNNTCNPHGLCSQLWFHILDLNGSWRQDELLICLGETSREMNKKEKNKNKPRIPGSRQLMKACHFYKSFLGLSEKHTPKSPAGRVWKDQLPGSPGSQAGIPHPHQCFYIASHRQSRPRTTLLGIMAPVTRDVLYRHFTLLCRVWNSTRRLCITLEARPFHTPPSLLLPRSTWSPLAEAGDTKQRKSQQNTDSIILHRWLLTAQALGTVILPSCVSTSQTSRKFSLESQLGQVGHHFGCC